MATAQSTRERAYSLASDYLKDGISPDQAISEFAEALDDAEALPSIVKALDSIAAGEKGSTPEEVKKRITARLHAQQNVG